MTADDIRPSRQVSAADVLIAAIALFAIVVRMRAAGRFDAPPGFDGGDWLALGRGILGRDVRPSGIIVPPVVPLLAFVVASVLPKSVAFVALAGFCGVAPGVGLYVALRSAAHDLEVALAAGLLVLSAASGEAAAWGGYPQLLALGLLPIVLVNVTRSAADPSRRWRAGVGLLAIALTSDFVFVVTLGASVLVLAYEVVIARRGSDLRGLVWLVAPLIVVVPLYVRIGLIRVRAVTAPHDAFMSRPLAERVDGLWFDASVPWRSIFVLGLIAVPLLVRRRPSVHWVSAAGLLAITLVVLVAFDETRLAFFVPTAVLAAVLLWHPEVPTVRRVPLLTMALAACFAYQAAVFPATAKRQFTRYQALNAGLVEGIDWLRADTAVSSRIVVVPFRNAPPLGWWIEGLARRRTFTASSEQWIYFPSERAQAAKAARVLSAGVPTFTLLRLARQMGVDYVFIDKRWADYARARVAGLERERPSTIAFENRAVVILRTRTAP